MELMLFGILVVSTLTGLTTEALKKLISGGAENVIALVTSFILSISVSVGYILYNGLTFDVKSIILIICLTFISALCSMLGYDKVIQTLKQVKGGK